MENNRMETRQERSAKLKKVKAHQRNSKWMGATLAVSLTAVSLFGQPEQANACDCATAYTVKKGDTIYSLAKKYQVSVEQLKSKNGFTSDTLHIGQQITVPTLDDKGQLLHLTSMEEDNANVENKRVNVKANQKVEQSVKLAKSEARSATSVFVAKKNGSVIHIVKSGDSLWKIANKYGTTIEQIRKANKLTSDALKIGQKLIVTQKGKPSKPDPGQKPVEKPKPPTTGSSVTYIVKSGDSLWKIANKYGTTIEQIRKANKLTSDALKIGQKLIVTQKGKPSKPDPGQKPVEKPKPPTTGSSVTYIVKSGDSLWKIANKYGTTIEQIRKANKLTSDALKIGQKLIITQKGKPSKPDPGQKPVEKPKPPTSGSSMIYIVKSGDSLWKIANKYGTTIEQIRKANKLTSDALKIGQKLIIYTEKKQTNKKEPGKIPGQKINKKPKAASSNNIIGKNEESLSLLAKKSNVFVEKVSSAQKSTVMYQVKAGDTLYALAERFNTEVSELMKLNQLEYPIAVIGANLQIPSDHVKRSQGIIVGAVDNTSIEVLINGTHQALEVSYGSSHNYRYEEGQQVVLTYTAGSDDHRPALINVAQI